MKIAFLMLCIPLCLVKLHGSSIDKTFSQELTFSYISSLDQILENLEREGSLGIRNFVTYQVIDNQDNTVLHVLITRIVEQMKKRNKTDEDRQRLGYNIQLINKLSNHFYVFKDKKNQFGLRPFDIILFDHYGMSVSGSIRNFSKLHPSEPTFIVDQPRVKQPKAIDSRKKRGCLFAVQDE